MTDEELEKMAREWEISQVVRSDSIWRIDVHALIILLRTVRDRAQAEQRKRDARLLETVEWHACDNLLT